MPTIYTLKNPINNCIYYVGYTTKRIEERLVGHLRAPKCETTKMLVNIGVSPIIEIVESGESVTTQTELYWIKKLNSEGIQLENKDGLINYQSRELIGNIPKGLLNNIDLTIEEKQRQALELILSELPLSSSTPIVLRIKTIIEWALSL